MQSISFHFCSLFNAATRVSNSENLFCKEMVCDSDCSSDTYTLLQATFVEHFESFFHIPSRPMDISLLRTARFTSCDAEPKN